MLLYNNNNITFMLTIITSSCCGHFPHYSIALKLLLRVVNKTWVRHSCWLIDSIRMLKLFKRLTRAMSPPVSTPFWACGVTLNPRYPTLPAVSNASGERTGLCSACSNCPTAVLSMCVTIRASVKYLAVSNHTRTSVVL